VPLIDIQNGGGGAYVYVLMNKQSVDGQVQIPYAASSMALFHVNGPSVTLEAFNPETFGKSARTSNCSNS
jgi:hypothetical protein